MPEIPPRPIKRLLVANRGEIAVRILTAARELDLETFALYTENDSTHTYYADHKIRMASPASYMSVDDLTKVVQEHKIDAVHPGYGFLSESPELAFKMADIDVLVIGPGGSLLEQTGDKLRAKTLAESCHVPVLPGLVTPTGNVEEIRRFVDQSGLPAMIKAVDGGGGRGIRLVRRLEDLVSLTRRAIEESPTKQVFAEKAAVDSYRHVEVQIIGDGKGNVMHLWERECSVQRRYQKIVEIAPSRITQREVVAPLIHDAVKMAQHVGYMSLGTFEFLLNPDTKEYYFLEINPRLQVEHTITESICGIDIVKAQLLLAQGRPLESLGFGELGQEPTNPPRLCSIQLRITAEAPEKDYSLSIGKIRSFHFPSGNGVRVDSALISGQPAVVSANFDSVIAKLIVTDRTPQDTIKKARRALADLSLQGVRTNVGILQAILQHPDFETGRCDTRWLESKHPELLQLAREISSKSKLDRSGVPDHQSSSSSTSASTAFRKDDAWHLKLSQPSQASPTEPQNFHIQLKKILRNEFPGSFSAEASITAAGAETRLYRVEFNGTSSSAVAMSLQHRQGNRSDSSHVIVPFAGTMVEVLVDVGDTVKEGDVICVIKQMKMELEIRSHKSGRCSWVTEAEDGEDVAEGILAAIVIDDGPRL